MGRSLAHYKSDLIGDHQSIVALRRLVERVATSPTRTVLLYGETGTGKGLVARMIHNLSPRASHDFMDINCAAIPGSLLESELFGHEKGAFTGAVVRKLGLIEAANGGTVFLDEIREMELTLQAKLLSLLDTHQFRRVGAVRNTSVDVRYIAATNKVLLSEVKSGKFREDLYYRLQVVAVNIPALRDRGEDVLLLAQHFIDRYNKLYQRNIRGVSPEVRERFLRYSWPGNVRELENLVERISILEDDDEILPRHLPDRIIRVTGPGATGSERDLVPGDLVMGFREATADFQRKLLVRALTEAGGNVQQAAELLKISRHALRHQMMKLGLT